MKTIFISVFSLCFQIISAQVNQGMPDILEVSRTFFSKYAWTYNSETDIQFEKRATGWYIRQDAMQPSAVSKPSVKFWNRATASYNDIPYTSRATLDSAEIDAERFSFAKRRLDDYQLYFYRRLNFFGYEGWDWDIMESLGDRKLMTDSLLESLGLANSHYAMGYVGIMHENSFINGDSNRQFLADSLPMTTERVNQFKHYTNRSIEAWTKLSKMSPAYETINSIGRYSPTMVKMEAFSILQFLGYESQAGEYLKDVTLADTLMKNMKQVLGELAPNSILLANNDAQNAAIVYLQAMGLRRDIIFIFEPTLVQRRKYQYLDKKYPNSLLGVESAVYMNPKYDYSFFSQQKADNKTIPLNEFLTGLQNSPALKMANDDPIQYYSKNVYLEVDKKKAIHLYGPGPFKDRLRIPVENDYLLMSDMTWLSIVNKNFLERRIYFLYPYYKDLTGTGIHQRGSYFELMPD